MNTYMIPNYLDLIPAHSYITDRPPAFRRAVFFRLPP